MDNADKLARGIVGPEIRKHLFITQNLTGPLVSPGLSYEANNIIAQAIRDAEKRGRNHLECVQANQDQAVLGRDRSSV